MKRVIALTLAAAFCMLTLSACSGKKPKSNAKVKNNDILKPTEEVNYELLQPDEDFTGSYKNDDYTAYVEKNDDGEMVITIKSAVKYGIGYEWVINGFFGDETYRVNYTDAAKYAVTFDKNGEEESREAKYTDGAGRITFADSEHFTWDNSMEKLDGSNEFEK